MTPELPVESGRKRRLQVSQTSELAVSGSLRGGRFRTYFKDLLTYSEPLQ